MGWKRQLQSQDLDEAAVIIQCSLLNHVNVFYFPKPPTKINLKRTGKPYNLKQMSTNRPVYRTDNINTQRVVFEHFLNGIYSKVKKKCKEKLYSVVLL